jgi:hypothetical protein
MTPLPDQNSGGFRRPIRDRLDVDERVQLYDEAAYALAAELSTGLDDRYTVVENHSDGHGTIPVGGIQLRPGRTIGAARFVVANPIGEEFIVTVEVRI